jgi:hypothetical protein
VSPREVCKRSPSETATFGRSHLATNLDALRCIVLSGYRRACRAFHGRVTCLVEQVCVSCGVRHGQRQLNIRDNDRLFCWECRWSWEGARPSVRWWRRSLSELPRQSWVRHAVQGVLASVEPAGRDCLAPRCDWRSGRSWHSVHDRSCSDLVLARACSPETLRHLVVRGQGVHEQLGRQHSPSPVRRVLGAAVCCSRAVSGA